MTFHIITIFPEIFDSYFSSSIIGRAIKNNLIKVKIYDLRDYTLDKHQKVDDAPYGGGAGMILQVEPIYRAVKHVINGIDESDGTVRTNIKSGTSRIILFSAKGKKYRQADALRLDRFDNLILICGRYEGVDERVAENIADEELSIGDYILSGGEIPAMAVLDSVSRLVPGVLGNEESIKDESFGNSKINLHEPGEFIISQNNKVPQLEYPQYTRPDDFNGWKVPEILISGHHEKIKQWRESKKKKN